MRVITEATCTKCGFKWVVNFGTMPNTTRCPNCPNVEFRLIKTENKRVPK